MIPPDLENTGIFDRVCPKNLPGHTNEKKKEVGEDKLGPMERELMIEGVDDKVFGREGGGGPAQGTFFLQNRAAAGQPSSPGSHESLGRLSTTCPEQVH